MDDNILAEIMGINAEYARTGLRVLEVAMRVLPENATKFTPDTVERDLVFLGLVAMMDPLGLKWQKRSGNAIVPVSG